MINITNEYLQRKINERLLQLVNSKEEYEILSEELKGGNKKMSDNNLDIPIIEKTSSFDVSKYEGYKCKIATVEKKTVTDFYSSGSFDPNSKTSKWVIEVKTEPLKELDDNGNATNKDYEFPDAEGNVKKLQVMTRFNLQEITDKSGNKQVVISKHPKSKLWQFLRKKGCNNLNELVGKLVTLTTVPSNTPGEEDRRYLRIVV